MTKRLWIIFVVAIGLTIGAVHIGADEERSSKFEIVVTTSGEGASMKCIKGCSWITTSFNCRNSESCTFLLDDGGVEGLRPDDYRLVDE